MARVISGTYGEALYELACEKGIKEELLTEVDEVGKLFGANPDYIALLTSPVIPGDEKLRVVEETFRGRVSDEMTGTILEVTQKGHIDHIQEIFDYYVARVKADMGIGVAYVTTPAKLGERAKAAVERKLLETTGYKKMEINYSVDESLIGGIVIRIGDRVADSSVKSKIAELRRQLLGIQLDSQE